MYKKVHPMKNTRFDIAIIGGGIVGLATAMALAQQTKASIVVLEAENRLAAHQTGNNSGVIHSGIYYKPGSLKAENCVRGRQKLYKFCETNDIPHERCGKVIVALKPQELPALEMLEKRGGANGLEGIKRLSEKEIRDYEPAAAGIAGLHVPHTGIVDYVAVVNKYAEIVRHYGGEIRTNSKVTAIKFHSFEFAISTSSGDIFSRSLINCGGLQADRIARMAGVNPGLQILPFRGEYYNVAKEKYHLVKNLIYPVPDPRFPFLGVHFTRRVTGGIEAGPNAILAFKREGYKLTSVSLNDMLTYGTYLGFWRMATKYWPIAIGEYYRSISKAAFVHALKALVPELESGDLVRGGAGVRAQALTPDGAMVDDFRIVETPNMIHVLNAPSPAATASISIGETIAEMARKNFDLTARVGEKPAWDMDSAVLPHYRQAG
jgi:L-2-hydroxyglutarate oxidase